MNQPDWEHLTPEEKKKELYFKQKRLLQTFLERHAITQEQYEKSLNGLTEKMGMEKLITECPKV